MKRRAFLSGVAGGVTVLFSAGCGLPPFPKRPLPDDGAASGWIRRMGGPSSSSYLLYLPRAECGQNVATALCQIACEELGIEFRDIEVVLADTGAIGRVRATVGSESISLFALPLARACARLRGAAAPRSLGGPGRHVGRDAALVQGRAIVTGQPLYAADVRLPGMLYGRVLRAPLSPELGAALLGVDEQAARAVPGFVALVRSHLFQVGGSAGIGIVARTPGTLERIEAALAPRWAAGRPAAGARLDLDGQLAQGRLEHAVRDDAIGGANWDVDLRFDIPAAAHGAIEPRCAVAQAAPAALTVWTGTQDAFYQRDVLCKRLGLEPSAVRVQPMRVGGAFGGRTICTVELEAAVLARAVGGTVKVQWTRAQEFAQGFHRPPSSHRIRAALKDGRIDAWWHAFVSSHILFTAAALPPWLQDIVSMRGDNGVARGAALAYQVPRQRIEYALARLPYFTGPWRGLGAGPNMLAVESAIDECARAAGADPLAFRLAHCADVRLRRVLSEAARQAGWPGHAAALAGRGIACGIYKGSSYAAVVADVLVDPADGRVRVTRLCCAHDCGLVINPGQVRAQVEGNLVWSIGMVLIEELRFERDRVAAASFADAPIARMGDVPPMQVALVGGADPPSGAGETAIVAGAAAIANAVRAACGLRAAAFPIRPAAVLDALAARP